MRFGKTLFCILTVLLLVLMLLAGALEGGEPSLSAVLSARGGTETLRAWTNDRGEAYLFLPGYGELSQVTLQAPEGLYRLGDTLVSDGMSCEGFSLDVPYVLTTATGEEPFAETVTFVRSGGMPALFLDVSSGSMDAIHGDQSVRATGTARLYSDDGLLLCASRMDALSGRGNSSWGWEKKSYNLELHAETDLLGMGAARNWALTANGREYSHLRSKIVFDTAKALGLAFTPECEWVDLYLNGEYAGLYLLTERPEVHSQRVDIDRSGTFLVSKDWQWRFEEKKKPYIMTDGGVALRIYHQGMSLTEMETIWQSAENAILSEDGVDPLSGSTWEEQLDLDSWAKKFLVEEVFGNVDGCTLSQFYYYDGSGRIFAGPAWDYDLTMGNRIAVPENGVNLFFANKEGVYGSPWLPELYKKEAFYDRMTGLYADVFRPLLKELLETGIDRYAETVAASARMNGLRWQAIPAAEETAFLWDYMTRRMAFLDSLWLEGKPYCTVRIHGYDGLVQCYAVSPGDPLPDFSTYEQNENIVSYGWYYADTGEPLDPAMPVTEDMVLNLKFDILTAEERAEEQEEPLSLLRLMPALLLLAMLAGVMTAALLRERQMPVVREKAGSGKER